MIIVIMLGCSLNFFFFQNLYLTSFFLEKHFNYLPFKVDFFQNLRIHFLFKNFKSNRLIFLLVIMLMHKLLGNLFYFRTTSDLVRNKFVPVGYLFEVSRQKIYQFLTSVILFSFVKLFFFSRNQYFLTDSKREKYPVSFINLQGILFFHFFVNTLDSSKYLHYFEKSVFRMKLKFQTQFHYYLLNRDLFRLIGMNFI